QVCRETRLERERRSVLEAHEADGEILDSILFRIPLPHQPEDAWPRAELGIRLAGGAHRLRVAHEPEGEIKNVHPDVDEGTTSLLVLLREDAPARNPSPAERLRPSVVDLTHLAGVDESLQRLRPG